jgi:hypothetical protein
LPQFATDHLQQESSYFLQELSKQQHDNGDGLQLELIGSELMRAVLVLERTGLSEENRTLNSPSKSVKGSSTRSASMKTFQPLYLIRWTHHL